MATVQITDRVDPRNLAVNITSSSGKVFRWGPDEVDGGNVPSGILITTQIPGGFGTFDCTLVRRPDLKYYDFDRFAPVTVTGAGGGLTAFDGYLASVPFDRSSGYAFSPDAIGWSGHMKDDPSFSMIYIDRVLSNWVGPSNARLLALIGAAFDTSEFASSAEADASGNASLVLQATGQLINKPIIEAWYDAGAGNVVGIVRAGAGPGGGNGYTALGYTFPDANVGAAISTANSDAAGGASSLGSFNTASGSINFSGIAQRYMLIQHDYNNVPAALTSGKTYGYALANLSVIGNHGLTLRTGPSGTVFDDGFWGGDIVADIIARAAPLLNFTTGGSGSIQPGSSFVVPQLAFSAPITADDALQQLNQYYLYDYGVYENRQFFWRPSATGRVWHVRVGDGATFTDQGPQIETAFNGVIVQYTDPAGVTRYVGPPPFIGDKDPVSGATNSTLLQDTTAMNPVNKYGRKRWALLQMSTSTWAGAVTVGAIFLQTTNSRPNAGTAIITGFARDANGRDWPAWMIRGGDTIIFDDTNDQTPHYILTTSYSHDSLQNSLTLDAPPDRLDWLLQRLSLAIAPLG